MKNLGIKIPVDCDPIYLLKIIELVFVRVAIESKIMTQNKSSIKLKIVKELNILNKREMGKSIDDVVSVKKSCFERHKLSKNKIELPRERLPVIKSFHKVNSCINGLRSGELSKFEVNEIWD